MITAAIVLVALLVLAVAALRLNSAAANAQQRFKVLTSGYSEVGLVAGARQRFRDRQRLVEDVLDTSTAGIETAHRTISQAMGHKHDHAAGFYAGVRQFNREFGRGLSGLFAPEPSQRDETLEEWRAREADKRPAEDDDYRKKR